MLSSLLEAAGAAVIFASQSKWAFARNALSYLTQRGFFPLKQSRA
jgi:hypothetical protein